jgi:hypothetical protein
MRARAFCSFLPFFPFFAPGSRLERLIPLRGPPGTESGRRRASRHRERGRRGPILRRPFRRRAAGTDGTRALACLIFRKVSESGGFIDRSPRTTRRHLTGRNHQFNAKATADTIRRFNAICDGQRWVAGLALDHLVALGEAALRLGTIAEAISALGRDPTRENRPKGERRV